MLETKKKKKKQNHSTTQKKGGKSHKRRKWKATRDARGQNFRIKQDIAESQTETWQENRKHT